MKLHWSLSVGSGLLEAEFVLQVYGVSLEFRISCQDLGYVLREVLPKRSPGQWLLYGLRNCVSNLCILRQQARVH